MSIELYPSIMTMDLCLPLISAEAHGCSNLVSTARPSSSRLILCSPSEASNVAIAHL